MFAYQEASQTRYGQAAAYSIVLFFYIVLVAFLFVKLLGADVIGDEAQGGQRAAEADAAPPQAGQGRSAVRTTITSGGSSS